MSALERPHFWKCSDLQKCAVSSFRLLRRDGDASVEALPAVATESLEGGAVQLLS